LPIVEIGLGGEPLLGPSVEQVDGVDLDDELDVAAHFRAAVRIDLGDQQIVADPAVDDDLVAERLDEFDVGRDRHRAAAVVARGVPRFFPDILRPDAEHDLPAVLARRHRPQLLRHRQAAARGRNDRAPVGQGGGEEVHRRRADEAGDEQVDRLLVDLERRAHLLQLAALHHGDAVAHRHRLDLVVGDVHGRGLERLLKLRDLGAGLHPQLGVEVRQRLVEQEDRRLAHDRAADRDPLALAAGELLRLALQVLGDAEDVGRLLHPAVHFVARRLADLEAELQVLPHRHVRIERVALEHHRDVAVLGRHVVDHPAADRDGAAGDLLQAGDHAQRRRLAAAGGADQHHELLVVDLQVQVLDDGHRTVALLDPFENHVCHGNLPDDLT